MFPSKCRCSNDLTLPLKLGEASCGTPCQGDIELGNCAQCQPDCCEEVACLYIDKDCDEGTRGTMTLTATVTITPGPWVSPSSKSSEFTELPLPPTHTEDNAPPASTTSCTTEGHTTASSISSMSTSSPPTPEVSPLTPQPPALPSSEVHSQSAIVGTPIPLTPASATVVTSTSSSTSFITITITTTCDHTNPSCHHGSIVTATTTVPVSPPSYGSLSSSLQGSGGSEVLTLSPPTPLSVGGVTASYEVPKISASSSSTSTSSVAHGKNTTVTSQTVYTVTTTYPAQPTKTGTVASGTGTPSPSPVATSGASQLHASIFALVLVASGAFLM
jgi:hypothetical protein